MPDYLIELADKARPALRRQVEAAIVRAASAVRLGQGESLSSPTVERTLMSAWVDEAVPRIAAATREMSQRVMTEGGRATMQQVRTSEAWRYDAVNPRAVEYVREHTGNLIVGITEAQREAIRQAIERVAAAEISSRQAEKHIRGVIGLTPRMETAVYNVRRQAIERGLTLARVDAVTLKYRSKVIRERAETIARTETIDALNAGREEAWKQAIDSGILPAASEKKWIVTYDDRLCPVCAAMQGERVSMEGTFTGGVSHPPRHPRCRCAIVVVRAQTTRLSVTRMERVPVLR